MTKMFSDGGLGRLAAQLTNGVRESVWFSAVEVSEAAITRLGGRPNFPAGMTWPIWKGKPLGFVAQIELGSLPAIRDLDLPRTGGLYFFYAGTGGTSRWKDRGVSRVLFSEQPIANLPLHEFSAELPEECRWKGVKLVGAPELTIVGYDDMFLAQIGMTDDEQRLYGKIMAEWDAHRPAPYGSHRIGGYPEYIQHEPKLIAHLIALDLYAAATKLDPKIEDRVEAFHEMNRRFAELKNREGAGATDWELLLQVNSDQTAGMCWGDVGRLYFLIRRDDLRLRRFEQVWMEWDCD